MSNDDSEREGFRTLRGAFAGDESDEVTYFAYSATLRIHGLSLPLDEITDRLGLQPTHSHRQGEKKGPRSPSYRDDAWHFQPALNETRPLSEHIDALWTVLRPHVEYLKALKDRYRVDIFCGYRSNSDTAGVEVPHTSLAMFIELEIPFGLSIIIA
jgi:hypothetical protein